MRDFLASRGITLPEGHPDDPPDAETVYGLGNRKNELLLKQIQEDGVEVFDGSVRYLEAVQQAGLHRAVVSSSANTAAGAAGRPAWPSTSRSGSTAYHRPSEHLHGKPAPDTFLDAARQLGVEPAQAAVFEDALAGVAAGRAGHFGFVVGVDRVGQAAGPGRARRGQGRQGPGRAALDQPGTHWPARRRRGSPVIPQSEFEADEWSHPRDPAGPGPAGPDRVGVRARQRAHRACAATWTRASRTACPAPT